jgi:hypothetical protein
VLLIEECGEVIQAATKCLRFGYDRYQPSYGQNDVVLAEEVGDLMGVVDALTLEQKVIGPRRYAKITRAETAKEQFGVGPK